MVDSDTPATRYCKIIKILRFCISICGSDVIQPNYRMWSLTYLIIAIILTFYACTLYTMYVGVVINNDWTVILQTMALAGSAIQGLTKLLCCVDKAHLVREIQTNYQSIYQEYELKGGEYTRCLNERITAFWNIVMAFVGFYIVVVGGMITYPLYYSLMHKEKMLIMQFLLPFIDHNTDTGHTILITFHVLCCIIGGFGNFGADMYLFLFILNVPLIKDIFKIKLHEFNVVAVQRDQYKQMRPMLRDLLDWHQKYARILRATEQTFKVVMLVELSTLCLSILCTISCIFLKAWPTAPLYLVYCFIVLYTFCGLGTVVETSNEEFTDSIYTHCVWYELPVVEQKLFILMLAKAQTELALTAMDVVPLSMATALQLTKGVYSFSMMLITYLE